VAEVNLLEKLPAGPPRTLIRSSDPLASEIAGEFGYFYFDGPRSYGYGGYRYDGRWQPVARDIIKHFKLRAGMRILDVGCAKGFLLMDLVKACPGLEVFGIDISDYALSFCAVGNVGLASAADLPFSDHSFDAVVSINTLHNLKRDDVVRALQEIMRVCKGGKAFVQVDSYHTPEQRAKFMDWVLTAQFHDYPDGWLKVFEESGYTGDWGWTIA